MFVFFNSEFLRMIFLTFVFCMISLLMIFIVSPATILYYINDKELLTKISACAGIGGDKCDECSVGYIQTYQEIGPDHEVHTRKIEAGETPTCTECGECFNNWQRILQGWSSGWRSVV